MLDRDEKIVLQRDCEVRHRSTHTGIPVFLLLFNDHLSKIFKNTSGNFISPKFYRNQEILGILEQNY